MFKQVLSIDLKYVYYKALSGGAFMHLPDSLSKHQKSGVINIKPHGRELQNCFELSVLCGMFHKTLTSEGKNISCSKSYQKYVKSEVLKFPCSFPMPISQIPKFETINNLKINVYSLKFGSNCIFPTHISKRKNGLKINLLLIISKQNKHFCYIKDLNVLSQKNTNWKSYTRSYIYCERCLSGTFAFCKNYYLNTFNQVFLLRRNLNVILKFVQSLMLNELLFPKTKLSSSKIGKKMFHHLFLFLLILKLVQFLSIL